MNYLNKPTKLKPVKTYPKLSGIITLLMIASFLISCNDQARERQNSEFINPPREAGVHTWWHWMDGNITKEGITKDLEAMHEQGIVQATILNIGLLGDRDFGIPEVKFASPEWFDMFRWALEEANRLEISIGIHNCDGWSTTGGPWISPELSMKEYTWTKTVVGPGRKDPIKLLQPQGVKGFYQDVAVLAVKSRNALSSFQAARPKVYLNENNEVTHLYDGCPNSGIRIRKGNTLTFKFEKAFTANRIALVPRRAFMWGDPDNFQSDFSISFSNDGKQFFPVTGFSISGLNKVSQVTFPETRAGYFRLEITGTGNQDSWIPVYIGECEFLAGDDSPLFTPQTEYFSEKTGSVKAGNISAFQPGIITDFADQSTLAIDITSKMNSDGILDWNPGEEYWTVIRFGYTTTGAENSPSTEAGRGLECDKMDTTALNLHFGNFPARLVEKAGSFTGNTFKFVLVDSWEAGFQNWTGNMLREFEERRGYSLSPYLQVLCGESTGNTAIDDAILFDFRKTIADLVENYYYRHYSELLHRNHLQMHAEVIYGETGYPALDILHTTSYIDLPMFEFWSSTNSDQIVKYTPSETIEGNMPVFAARGYEKNVVGAEAYTGMAHYSETFSALKPFGDRAFCQGINQMILHSYVHQPDEMRPGFTLGQFGSHFNRNNTYWPYIGEWLTYHARIQDILQNSDDNQDILYYLGDQLPQSFNRGRISSLPFGYAYNAINYDILKNRITVRSGKVVLNGKTSYSLLVMPPDQRLDYATLMRMEELVKSGMILYGSRPEGMLSLKDQTEHAEDFEKLVTDLWGEAGNGNVQSNSYGKGKVYEEISLLEVLEQESIIPDIKTSKDDRSNLMFIHKQTLEEEIYFVMNQQDKKIRREISFRISDRDPMILDPETGSVEYPAIYSVSDDYITLPMELKPYQSIIVIFKKGGPGEYVQKILENGKQIFPAETGSDLEEIPSIIRQENSLLLFPDKKGDYEAITNHTQNYNLKTNEWKEFEIKDFSCELSFEPGYPALIPAIETGNLNWLSESDDTQIKYFSGTTVYRISFPFPVDSIGSTDSVYLDPGEIGAVAKVALNGHDLGTVWSEGRYLPVTNMLSADNRLVVYVANTYRNRIIGDFREYGELRNIETTAPVRNFLSKDSPLQSSGLKGPVKILAGKVQKLSQE